MSKHEKKCIVSKHLTEIGDFLSKFLHIANAHTSDFITENLWEKLTPTNIAKELLSLPEEKLIALPHAKSFIKDFELSKQKLDAGIYQKQNDQLKSELNDWSLLDFMCEVRNHTLSEMGVLSDSDDLGDIFGTEDKKLILNNSVHIAHGMTEKKSHEIELMTQLCAQLTKRHGMKHVVDIGSGKGYLGCQLAMTHKLYVLGIDSSQINKRSADIRTERVKKFWNGLVRNAIESKQRNSSDHTLSNTEVDKSSKPSCKTDLFPNSELDKKDVHPVACNVKEKQLDEESTKLLVSGAETRTSCSRNPHGIKATENLYVQITEFLTSQSNISQIVHEHLYTNMHCDNNEGSRELLVSGLHTCGDLASNILRLFVNDNDVRAVCNVGCCYHHLNEEFVASPFADSADQRETESGFPLSCVLRSTRCKLGRNARMLACQAPDRQVQGGKMPDRSLYWRALLQVILKDITGTTRNDWNVGKIANKCLDFTEYVNKALAKLKIETKLTKYEINQYQIKYEHFHHKLNAFFQFKNSLATCIEAIILLDRLHYLLEQENTANACLIQLFDPVLSPRCSALVATKGVIS